VNDTVARRLEEVATLLEEQGAVPFQVQRYRRAADALRHTKRDLAEVLSREGPDGVVRLTGIGESLAQSIASLVRSGTLPILDRLRGRTDPLALLASVPGVGHVFAVRIHHELGLDTLEDLEDAARDGSLSRIAGMGTKRIAGIMEFLAFRLGGIRRARAPEREIEPPVSELLEVDREYRAKAARGVLRTIAPRAFNPGGASWLPVLHTLRGERHYTVLYANTPRAHRAGKTYDWVVLYHDGGCGERHTTVITGAWGPLEGCRIIPGREEECAAYYELPASARRIRSATSTVRSRG
jgi:hypothetical protein